MMGHDAVRLPLLTFRLGERRYALLIEDVVEVAAMVDLLKIPAEREELLGYINRRGKVLPLLDLRTVFKQPFQPITSASVFIVVAGGDHHFGLVVDAVEQVEYVDALQLSDSMISSPYLHGIISHQDEMISIIALPALLALAQ
ncbi:MAG: chemotaxis protein CheW [Chloroflexi bacterium]|nr:chemotaxis protein CheW [Chloroflexota bacterium]MCC6893263.1 chemotaxis protein CheW [Anaerolineae bacterium]